MRILISGGEGRFAQAFIKHNKEHELFAPNKRVMDITNKAAIEKMMTDYYPPDIFLHAAAFTRPMSKHNDDPIQSVNTNIIGTANIVMACIEYDIKLIYISTDYVYPGITGNYKEDDPLLSVNKYGWSKMGGECAVRLYDNSLILRMCMNNKPFPHLKAIVDIKKSLIYDDEAAQITHRLLGEKGIINVGGKSRSIYDFAKEENPDIEKMYFDDVKDVEIAKNTTLNIDKMKRLLEK